MSLSELTLENLQSLAKLGDYPDPFPPPHLPMDKYFEYLDDLLQNMPSENLDWQHRRKMKHLIVPFRM